MSKRGPGSAGAARTNSPAGLVSLARRSLLATPCLLVPQVRAQALDDSLTGVMGRGVLRVNIGFWMAKFMAQPGEAEPRLQDGFHQGMARMIAQGLGVRAELHDPRQSHDGARRLLDAEMDLALAPPLTRGLLRQVMFCAPHAEMDLVVVGGALPLDRRGRTSLEGLRLGGLALVTATLAERRSLTDVMPFASPWPMVRQLLEGQLDGIVLSRVMAYALLRLLPEANLRVHVALGTSVFAGAVAYGAHDLRRAINSIVAQLRMDGRLAQLFRRETGLPFNPPHPS